MDEPWSRHANWKRPGTKAQLLHEQSWLHGIVDTLNAAELYTKKR
jgi:hypothetical protein